MAACLLALGSNLGDRAAMLDAAIGALANAPGVELVRHSAWQLTIPVGGSESQPEFLNGAALIATSRGAAEVHALLAEIESQLGRKRHERWGDRTLDLDLLLYGNEVLDTPTLTLPHPRMSFRRFVLEPAVEIAGSLVHPTIGWTLDQLLDHLDTGADCVAIVSSDTMARASLAATLVERFRFAVSKSMVDDAQLWLKASTTWLTVPDGHPSIAHPKLTILLNAPSSSEMGLGPTLRICPIRSDEGEREAFAAVEAVWPRLGPSGGQRLQ